MGSASVGDLVMFAGGNDGSGTQYSKVDIYNVVTQAWSTAALSGIRNQVRAVTVGTLVVFAGGAGSSGATNAVDIYHSSTNTWSTAQLSQARKSPGIAPSILLIHVISWSCGRKISYICRWSWLKLYSLR